VAAYDGPMDEISWTPQTVTAAVLDLAGDLAEHLRGRTTSPPWGSGWPAELEGLPGRVPAGPFGRSSQPSGPGSSCCRWSSAYAAAKAAREVLDHGDQVALAARIASAHPEVGAAERARYQVVLLDEYQDTSHAQLVLLRALFGGGHPVTAVGDPCQSIYGWRGASAGNLRRFTADFPRPGPAVRGLGVPVRLLSDQLPQHRRVLDAAAALQADCARGARRAPAGRPRPDRADRGAVACALLDTVADEAEWVAGQIAGLLASRPAARRTGSPGRTAAGRVRPSDIAVLCRKRSQFVPLRRRSRPAASRSRWWGSAGC
jgi:DNA helicase-2/ATP-dependent DNA helicase PcrA